MNSSTFKFLFAIKLSTVLKTEKFIKIKEFLNTYNY